MCLAIDKEDCANFGCAKLEEEDYGYGYDS